MRLRYDHEVLVGRNCEGGGRCIQPAQPTITTEGSNQKSWDSGQDRNKVPPKCRSYLIANSALAHAFIPLGTQTTNSACLTYLLTYLLTYILHGTESLLRS
jgi:hypothetical protein